MNRSVPGLFFFFKVLLLISIFWWKVCLSTPIYLTGKNCNGWEIHWTVRLLPLCHQGKVTMDHFLCRIFFLLLRNTAYLKWKAYVKNIHNTVLVGLFFQITSSFFNFSPMVSICNIRKLCIDCSYISLLICIFFLFQALLHASVACRRKLCIDWVPASDLEVATSKEVSN